jgi:acetyl esterase/lipase
MVKFILSIVLCLASGSVFAATGSYGPYPEQTYETCGDPTSTVAVAVMHGGWDTSGSFDNPPVRKICKYLGQRKVWVVAFNYRLAKTDGQGWPAAWQDAQLVVRWLKSKNYKRVGLIGVSAGAYNALGSMLSGRTIVWPATDPKREALQYLGTSSLPAFAVVISPFSDLSDPSMPASVTAYLTKDVARIGISQTAANNLASPVTYARPDTRPLLLVHGTADTVVPVAQTKALYSELANLGAHVDYIETPGGHVFERLNEAQQLSILKTIDHWCQGHCGSWSCDGD